MSKSHYIIPIFVPHEGCPHNCVFCNQNSITGEANKVNAKLVKDTIEEYLKTINKENATVEVSFFGGTFTAIDIDKQKELLAVAKMYKDCGKIDYIHLSTRPDYIDKGILENLKKYSTDIIELGIQSLDNGVLLKAGRGHTEEDVIRASHIIKEHGFILGHQIMLGLPGDDFKKDIETTKKIIKLKPDIARIYPSLVIKDTLMEKMYNCGIYSPYTLEEAVEISKEVYAMFIANDINVIRVGLQPTEEINWGKDLIAGPFHPAFRELVEGSIYNDIILEEIQNQNCDDFTININNKDLSKLYAYKKKKFKDMESKISPKKAIVQQKRDIRRGEMLLVYNNICKNISLKDYLKNKYKEG
ncbi:radical SAM protein [Clostridium sp. MB40-C1]|uniref:elongator complex protein 3 n=1 Tax=Clostridium sp. MB40-C1 TaxID=3070996 RepID=UPI0027E1F720|nr:radical SAM protein [Clostridium sp. MB40-C1]WMJ82073.1 radical SAM protein [Clostridium sp. MB40-C1]